MKVLKFGGSSVRDTSRIIHVSKLIQTRVESESELAVIFSAFGGVTDLLIHTANEAAKGKKTYISSFEELKSRHLTVVDELLSGHDHTQLHDTISQNFKVLMNLLNGIFLVREASPRTLDYVLSFGERNSCQIISGYLNHIEVEASYLDARNIIKTNKEFGNAKVAFKETNEL